MKRSALLPIAVGLVTAAAALGGCGRSQDGAHQGMPPAAVSTVTVQPADIPVAFEHTGQTIGSKEVEVRARVTGILGKRLFNEGSPVKAGQPLFLIDPATFEAQAAAAEAELSRARAQLAQSQREAARLKPLAEKRAVGQKEADDAQSNAELAAAAVKSAEARLKEAQLSLGYTRVNAPISGLSGRAAKSEGSLVNANETLLTAISQTDPMWIQFFIAENDQLRLSRAAAEGKLALPKDNGYEVTVRLSDNSTLPRKGTINFADPRVGSTTGSYEMRASFANADGLLKPGQFVRVTLGGAVRKNAIAVPQVAVMDGPQGKFVYVPGKDKDGKEVALPRPVTVGDWVDGVGGPGSNRWIVESGLAAGDAVIVEGLARVMFPGQPITVVPPGGAATPPTGAPPADDSKKK
ncbi:MAG: efflux RND transporter periplasmic adaptor subunit [Burkholderiaceae bacterium]